MTSSADTPFNDLDDQELEEGEPPVPGDPVTEAQEELAAAREVLHAVQKEHRRISRDLHDSVGQELYGLSLLASNLARQLRAPDLGSADLAEVADIADLIAQSANDAQRMLRRAIKGVMPAEVQADGLPKALSRWAGYVRDRYGVDCVALVPDTLVLPDHECAGALLKITQQACINAAKYAEPTRIQIRLEKESTGYRLSVENDGLPIQINDSDSVTGIGLAIMRTRAKVISGTFLIEPLPEGGTRVEVFLPEKRRLGGAGLGN